MANSSINLVGLDFDTYKSDLISFLRTQDQFKDYNFEASNMNVLLDLLAYNTYKNSFYLNMVFAESFLDSAQMRQSIFSHAKELNYLPRSSRSAVANVTLSFTASGESQPYLIRKGETFTTIIKQNSYTFSTDDDILLTSPNNTFSTTFNIYEGFYVKETYIVDYGQGYQRFKINNPNVDTDSIVVLVYEDNLLTPKKFTRATSLLGLTESSEVYFIQGSVDAQYEILFGDGVLGRRPKNGSTIVIDYRTSSGSEANGAKTFAANFDPTGGELTSAIVVGVNRFSNTTAGAYSVNGDSPESTDSIRYYAPRYFQTQERAVTVNDYEIVLKTQFPEIGAVSVYGGEEVNPPRYGKVFVAIDIKNVDGLPDAKKQEYYTFLKSRSPLSIDPIFVEPQFTYVRVNTKVKFNQNITTRTAQNLKTATALTVTEFANKYLNDFKSTLHYSKLVASIDDVDTSIISNDTEIHAYKKLPVILGTPQNIIVNFGFPIKETDYVQDTRGTTVAASHKMKNNRSIHSSLFTFNGEKCLIEEDGVGNLRVVKQVGDTHYVVKSIGTVDYKTGYISLVNLQVDSYEGNALKLFVSSAAADIYGLRNEVLTIEPNEIYVDVEAVRE